MASRKYTHVEVGQEVDAISGHYLVNKETQLAFGDREVLYILGSAMFDTSCCGEGGCGYALVPGYILGYKTETDTQGQPVSVLEPIVDQSEQETIKQLIIDTEHVHQVNFW